MNEKRYLKWYQKIGYGSGDIAGNVIYSFLASFVMIYLTDTVGLKPGIVGTLMAVSKLFDGVTDILFGSLIDRTKTKMGKARPWMLWPYIGNAILLFAIFAVPSGFGETAQYAYFFITYTLLNAVFYTANNIAYSALTALITKNEHERVQLGSYRFIFAFLTGFVIQKVTVDAVAAFGGGAEGWRAVALIYAVIGLAVNTLSVLSVRELPEEEQNAEIPAKEEKYSLLDAAKLLFANKFYLMICGIYILSQIYSAILGVGIYFMTYVLGNADLLGDFAAAINIPMIAGLICTPFIIRKAGGMYRVNLVGYGIAAASRALVMAAGYMGNVPMMLVFTAAASIGMSPMQGDLNALIASCSEYTCLTKGRRIDGTMFSCTSLGVKIGGGIGTALSGWLLEAGGYINGAAVQPESCVDMLYFMYLWLPVILNLVITVLLGFLKVEQANAEIRKKKI